MEIQGQVGYGRDRFCFEQTDLMWRELYSAANCSHRNHTGSCPISHVHVDVLYMIC